MSPPEYEILSHVMSNTNKYINIIIIISHAIMKTQYIKVGVHIILLYVQCLTRLSFFKDDTYILNRRSLDASDCHGIAMKYNV